MLTPIRALLLACLASGCASSRLESAPSPVPEVVERADAPANEGPARGYPELGTLAGERLADGEFRQWVENDRLHVVIRYEFGAGRFVEETSVLRQEPVLVQEHWSWTEMRSGVLERRFEIDFLSGEATAEKREEKGWRRWSKHVDLEPGRAFAGAQWALAVRGAREQLLRGEKLEFQTVGFTPQPRKATVEIGFEGLDTLAMAGRTLESEHYRIHPKVPWIARPFVEAPDSHLWLAHPPPAAFLRFEGPLAEPSDDLVRVDLLPSGAGRAAPPPKP